MKAAVLGLALTVALGLPALAQTGTATRAKTLAAQWAEVGVKPADIRYLAVSHHPAITSATSTCSGARRS